MAGLPNDQDRTSISEIIKIVQETEDHLRELIEVFSSMSSLLRESVRIKDDGERQPR